MKMMKNLIFCFLLLTFSAAFEMYDEYGGAFGVDQSGNENYNEDNYDYPSLGPYQSDIRNDAMQNLMLMQLFKALENRNEARLHMPYRPKNSIMENPLAFYGPLPYSELMDYHGAFAKRHAGNTNQKVKPESPKPTKEDAKIIGNGY